MLFLGVEVAMNPIVHFTLIVLSLSTTIILDNACLLMFLSYFNLFYQQLYTCIYSVVRQIQYIQNVKIQN